MSRRMTFPEFVEKARAARGDRFEYRDEGWTGVKSDVLIICPDHGEFRANASWHLKGVECPRCSRPRAGMTFAEFVTEANSLHAGAYVYNASSWSSVSGSVSYTCPRHGPITQVVRDHLDKGGCRHCGWLRGGVAKRMSLQVFVQRARAVHGDAYEYLHGMGTGKRRRMTITCPRHGEFIQARDDHLGGNGCHECASHVRRTGERFVADAIAVHGSRFTYPRTNFVNTMKKVIVTCPVHGDFSINASSLLQGRGCMGCAGLARKTTSEFISEAVSRFGDRYDYSKVDYVNKNTKVSIFCRKHGVFQQKPSQHLISAVGCPMCTYSVSRPETKWLDSLGIDNAFRQARVILDSRSRSVDAYNPDTNTVYEFWGSWWHGDPLLFDSTDLHKVAQVTYGELYRRTMEKRSLILSAGYLLVDMWESDFCGLVRPPRI